MAPVAAARLNPSDATQEAWVDVGRGAYTGHLSIFVFRSCQLAGHTRRPLPLATPQGDQSRLTCPE